MKRYKFFVDKWKASFVFKPPGGSPSFLVLLKHMVVALKVEQVSFTSFPIGHRATWIVQLMREFFQRQCIKDCNYFPNIPSTKTTKGVKAACLRSQATKNFLLNFFLHFQ